MKTCSFFLAGSATTPRTTLRTKKNATHIFKNIARFFIRFSIEWKDDALSARLRQQLKHLENCAHRDDGRLTVKSQLIAIVAAVLVVGCGETQQSVPQAEAKPEPPSAKAPDISIHDAARDGNIEAVKQHLAAGADVNTIDVDGKTPADRAVSEDKKETADLLRKHGGKTGEELKAEGK
jgi:hypothetical protein